LLPNTDPRIPDRPIVSTFVERDLDLSSSGTTFPLFATSPKFLQRSSQMFRGSLPSKKAFRYSDLSPSWAPSLFLLLLFFSLFPFPSFTVPGPPFFVMSPPFLPLVRCRGPWKNLLDELGEFVPFFLCSSGFAPLFFFSGPLTFSMLVFHKTPKNSLLLNKASNSYPPFLSPSGPENDPAFIPPPHRQRCDSSSAHSFL